MIDVGALSYVQKRKLQIILEREESVSYGTLVVSIGYDPMARLRALVSHGMP
jgi:hypothetical protein